jgi:nucleotide-binding universal stress UspA family protein/predicted transcriptional regulator
MAFPFRRILSPIDFDESSMTALDNAVQLARQNDGTIFLMHVVPMIIPPTGMPIYVDLYKGQEETAREKLKDIAHRRLAGIKYELLTRIGEPAATILKGAKKLGCDVIVMATHGRRGFSRVFLGSVAEIVVREAPCPVLTVHQGEPDKHVVARWMTTSPVTATPDEKLGTVRAKMREGGFRTVPVLREGKLVGVVSDRDLRNHTGYEDHTEVKKAMTTELVTVLPTTPVAEAARLLHERKVGGLPVVEDGNLVGMITTSDVLRAFVEE